MTTLQIAELFVSIQGESSQAGRPCGFIRLAGCSLRCRWCDTSYAFGGGQSYTLEEVLGAVAAWGVELVEVTGGEPLEQKACYELLRALCARGYEVLLETGGACSIRNVDERVRIILDVKCPASGEDARNDWANLRCLKPGDEVKFVIQTREDYAWAAEIVRREPALRHRTVLFSPVHDVLHPGELAQWVVEDALPIRLQLQLHKYLWPGVERGV